MADLNTLIQMAQAAGLGGGGGGAPPPSAGGNIPGQQNMGAYLQAQGSMPMAPNPMAAAVQSVMGGGGGYTPPVSGDSPTSLSGPSAMMLPGNINNPDDRGMALGVSGRTGPGGDSDWYAMHEANQGVRGNLPIRPTNDYSGYGDEMNPMPEPRQTPKGKTSSGGPVSDEEELNDIQNKMGGVQGPGADRKAGFKSGNPSDDGNFPPQREINALNRGEISPAQFDAKWGKGAAKEMMSGDDDNADMYEGDDK